MIAAESGSAIEFNGGMGVLSDRVEAMIGRKAVKQRWPIPEKYKQAVIDRQVKIAISPSSSNREATSAARVLVAAEAQNQADDREEPVGGQHVHFHQHGSEVANGTGLHSTERLERLRSKLVERSGASGT